MLKKHMDTAAGNALYTSKTIQNDLISICGDIFKIKILTMVQQSDFFSNIAHEATVTSNDEQLSFSVHFLDDGVVSEKFIAFTNVTKVLVVEPLQVIVGTEAPQCGPQG